MEIKKLIKQLPEKLKVGSSGNSILEMIVFLPVALLFGILAMDATFSVTDKASITDAIRAGLGDYKTARQTANIAVFKDGTDALSYTNTAHGTVPEVNEEFLYFLAEKIFKNVADTRKESEEQLFDSIQVDVHAVLLRISGITGAYNGFDIIKSVSYGGSVSNSPSTEEMIQRTIASYNHAGVSPFATPNLVPKSSVLAEVSSHEHSKYNNYSVIIFADATIFARNTNTELRHIFYGTYNTQRYVHFIKL